MEFNYFYKENKMNLFDLTTEDVTNYDNLSGIKSNFFKDLIECYQYYKDNKTARSVYDIDTKAKLENIIKKHTGIKVNVSKAYKYFAMMPPDINKNHVLVQSKGLQDYFDNNDIKGNGIKGTVDIKNYKVSGDFSEISIDLYIEPALIFGDYYVRKPLTARELAAITLHEVGHMFSYFSMVYNSFLFNIPMLATLNRITKCKNTDEIKVELKKHNEKETTYTKVDVNELGKKKKEVVMLVLLTNYSNDLKNINKNTSSYDTVNGEYIADKYATRHGAGEDLVKGLEAIYKAYGVKLNQNSKFFTYFIDFGYLILTIAALTQIFTPSIFYSVYLLLFISTCVTNAGDGTYDILPDRYKRIRDDLVLQLKNKDIDPKIGDNIRGQIKVIDDILKKFNYNKSIMGMFFDFIWHYRHKLVTQTEMYREIEALANNRLFLAAYDLKHLK